MDDHACPRTSCRCVRDCASDNTSFILWNILCRGQRLAASARPVLAGILQWRLQVQSLAVRLLKCPFLSSGDTSANRRLQEPEIGAGPRVFTHSNSPGLPLATLPRTPNRPAGIAAARVSDVAIG